MTRILEVVSSNHGAIYWMDMPFLTLICCKNCTVCLKIPKINKKRLSWNKLETSNKPLSKGTLHFLFTSVNGVFSRMEI